MLTNVEMQSLISLVNLDGAISVAHGTREALAACSMSDDTREALADIKRMNGGK